MYPSKDPIVGPMVDSKDNPRIITPNFIKPFFSSKISQQKKETVEKRKHDS